MEVEGACTVADKGQIAGKLPANYRYNRRMYSIVFRCKCFYKDTITVCIRLYFDVNQFTNAEK